LIFGQYIEPAQEFLLKFALLLFISVKDNGNGIPQKVKEKIFDPPLLPSLLDKERDLVYP